MIFKQRTLRSSLKRVGRVRARPVAPTTHPKVTVKVAKAATKRKGKNRR